MFPANFANGYQLKDDRISATQEIPIRRVRLKDRTASSIRPSFLMPYLGARTAEVEDPQFHRKLGFPFWALARIFGDDDDVRVSPGVRARPLQRSGDHPSPRGTARAPPGG